MRVSELVFNYFQLLYCKSHKINLSCGGSYTDSPGWIKNKKATINPVNKKGSNFFLICCNSCIKRITKIKPFMNKYNWEGINYLSEKKR